MSCEKGDDTFELQEKDVLLLDQSHQLELDEKDPVHFDQAVLLNACNMGYGIFNLDDRSMYFFEKYLSEVYNYSMTIKHTSNSNKTLFTKTNMLVVIDQIFKMMENGLYSVNKLHIILQHLLKIREKSLLFSGTDSNNSTDELILETVSKFWQNAVRTWLPIQHYESVCSQLSDFFLKKAAQTKNDKLKDFCLTKLTNFACDERTIKLVIKWILDYGGQVMVDGIYPTGDTGNFEDSDSDGDGNLCPIDFELTTVLKYYMIKNICASTFVNNEQKQKVMEKVFGQDTSDSTIRYR
jgi:hypothetical protein